MGSVTNNFMNWIKPLYYRIILLSTIFVLQSVDTKARIARTLTLTKQDIVDLLRIEKHLNTNKTIRSRFLQVSSDGSYAEGILHVQRPGKMRIEYDAPNPTMIIADGINLLYIDKKLEQVTPMLLIFTPADFILRNKITFSSEDVLVTGFSRTPGVIRVSVVKAKNPLEGQIMLVFSDSPLELRKWIVTDGQGIKTTVSLLGAEFGVQVNSDLFEYEIPDAYSDNN